MKPKASSFREAPAAAHPGMKALRLGGGAALMLLMLTGCSTKGKTVRNLLPEEKQFLSEVRYLISNKEAKAFKNTPPEERPKFIEEFWKVRDPDPTTEENEFRDEYYRRIDEANRLFREGGAGWLTDRGRVYILLGEPERRDVYPSGYSFYQPPVEIWYYNMFPVIFVDYQREGIYKLEPTSVRNLSMINFAQMQLKPKGIERTIRAFDFTLTKKESGPGGVMLRMEVPYRVTNLLLNDKTGVYETQIKMTVRISAADGKTALEKEELHPVSVSNEMLVELGKEYVIEFACQLPPGKYTAQVTLENTTDKAQARKEIKIEL